MKHLLLLGLVFFSYSCGSRGKSGNPSPAPSVPAPAPGPAPVTPPAPIAVPNPIAPPDGPVAIPDTLTLTPPTAVPLTGAQQASFDAFVQAQERLSHFHPVHYLFEFAKVETTLTANQAALLANLRDTHQCAIQSIFDETQVTELVPGTKTNLALNLGLQGTGCAMYYRGNSTMKMTYQSVDLSTGNITTNGTIAGTGQIYGANALASGEIGLTGYGHSMGGTLAMIATNATAKVRHQLQANTDVTFPGGTYHVSAAADLLLYDDRSSGNDLGSYQLSAHFTIASPGLALPITISLLTNVSAKDGVPDASVITGYVNGVLLGSDALKALMTSQFGLALIDDLGYSAPLVVFLP